jgi:hypothetical protein
MFEDVSSLKLSFRGAGAPLRTRTPATPIGVAGNLNMGVTELEAISGFSATPIGVAEVQSDRFAVRPAPK